MAAAVASERMQRSLRTVITHGQTRLASKVHSRQIWLNMSSCRMLDAEDRAMEWDMQYFRYAPQKSRKYTLQEHTAMQPIVHALVDMKTQ